MGNFFVAPAAPFKILSTSPWGYRFFFSSNSSTISPSFLNLSPRAMVSHWLPRHVEEGPKFPSFGEYSYNVVRVKMNDRAPNGMGSTISSIELLLLILALYIHLIGVFTNLGKINILITYHPKFFWLSSKNRWSWESRRRFITWRDDT